MMTLPLQALAPRPAPRPERDAADPDAPSFGAVLERAQLDAPAASPTPTRPGGRHLADHEPSTDSRGGHGESAPAARGERAERPANAERPGVTDRRFEQDATPDTAPAADEADASTTATGAATSDATEPADEPADTTDAPSAPGAIPVLPDGALQHAAAATGLAAAGVVEVSNTDDPVAPAGLPSPTVAAVAVTTMPTAAASAATPTTQVDPTLAGEAPGRAAVEPSGPTVTNVTVETVAATPTTPGAPAPTMATSPEAPHATVPAAPATPAGASGAATSDAPTTPDPSLSASPGTAPASAASGAAPSTPPTTPSPTSAQATVAAAAATATAGAPLADDTGTADAGPAPTRSAAAPTVPPRSETPPATTAPSPAARTADTPLSQGDGVTPSRIVDLVERAQRESSIRRAEQSTRLGMDVATDGLGSIRIEATNNAGGLHLNLGAERQATRQLLADQANVLRDELGGAGVSVDVSSHFGSDASARQHDGGERPATGDRSAGSSSSTVPLAPRPRQAPERSSALQSLLTGDRGVDLHL